MFESGHKKPEKRKKVKGGDAEEIDNFLGPWAKYVDEKSVAKPTEVLLSFHIYCEIYFKVYTHYVFMVHHRRRRKSWMRSRPKGRRRAEMRRRLQQRRRLYSMVLL